MTWMAKQLSSLRKKFIVFNPSVPEPEAQRYFHRSEDELFTLRRYLSRISPTVLLLSICSNSRDTGLLEIFHPLSVYSSSILLSHIRGSFFPKNKQIKDRLWECLTGNQCQSERQWSNTFTCVSLKIRIQQWCDFVSNSIVNKILKLILQRSAVRFLFEQKLLGTQ